MVARWSEEAALTIVGETFFPEYRITVLSAVDLKDCQEPVLEDVNRITLQRGAVDLEEVTTAKEYFGKNPYGLVVNVPALRDGMLYEASISAMNDDDESIKFWHRLKSRTKRSLSKGVWIVNDLNGASVRDNGHSYSSGARELQDAGVVMVGHTEQIRYVLD
jgi:hypothetical protein